MPREPPLAEHRPFGQLILSGTTTPGVSGMFDTAPPRCGRDLRQMVAGRGLEHFFEGCRLWLLGVEIANHEVPGDVPCASERE